MTVKINASTSSGLVMDSDLSGTIELQANGVTKATVSSTGVSIPTNVVTTLNSPSGALATQNGMSGIAKAWCNYNASSQTVIQSFNISSVTYNSSTDYTFNYTTALTNANNSVVAMGSGDGGLAAPNLYGGTGTNLTTSVRVYAWGAAHFASCIAVFGI